METIGCLQRGLGPGAERNQQQVVSPEISQRIGVHVSGSACSGTETVDIQLDGLTDDPVQVGIESIRTKVELVPSQVTVDLISGLDRRVA